MLYFVRPPDAPFTALLALTHELATAGFRRRWTAQEYAGAFPTVAPWWSPTQAGREWRWLWEIHQRRQVYNVDDHHWALLFNALRLAITVANAGSAPGQLLPLGPIRPGVIDAELLIDAFFWHLRFLDEGFAPPAPAPTYCIAPGSGDFIGRTAAGRASAEGRRRHTCAPGSPVLYSHLLQKCRFGLPRYFPDKGISVPR